MFCPKWKLSSVEEKSGAVLYVTVARVRVTSWLTQLTTTKARAQLHQLYNASGTNGPSLTHRADNSHYGSPFIWPVQSEKGLLPGGLRLVDDL